MVIVALILTLQQPVQPPPATPPVRPAPSAPQRRAQPPSSMLEVRVTDRSGRPIADATLTSDGPTSRTETTDARGAATLSALAPGSYRVRVEADHFISLEKEIAVRGAMSPQQFSLSRAPEREPEAAPPPPPPPPVVAAPVVQRGAAGQPKVVSLPDLAEQSLGGRDAVKIVPIACAGTDNVRMIVLRDTLPLGSHKEESQTLYLLSGQASLTIRDSVQQLSPGTVGIVPREVPYALEKKGRNPAVLLSVTGGQPCGDAAATQ